MYLPKQMRPTDITFRYKVAEYERLHKFLSIGDRLKEAEIQFLFSLSGVEVGTKIPLNVKDDSDKVHNISRTSFERDVVTMERDFGLITIADSLDEPYHEVLNNKAFKKNSEEKVRYLSMPNVSTFYEYMLGGIEPLYEIIMGYGTSDSEIFDSMYEFLTSKENIEMMDHVSKMVGNDYSNTETRSR